MTDPVPTPRPTSLRRDPLMMLLAWNGLAGAVVAVLLTAAVLALDIASLRSLIARSEEPVVPLVLLVFGFLVTLCSVAMGSAVMGLGRDEEEPGGSGDGAGRVRVPVGPRRR